MLGEVIQECVNAISLDLMLAATFVILVVIGYGFFSHVQNPGVGDGHTIGIPPDVFKDLIDSFCRRLRIDNPRRIFTLPPYFLADDDIFLLESPSEQGHEPAVEFVTHGTNGKQEVAALTSLEMMPRTAFIHSAARYDAVNMRMVEQIGSPGVEDGCHASVKSLPGSKRINGSPCSLEHTVVKDALVGHCNGMQAIRHCEYDMEVLGRDNLFPTELNPLLALLVLTLWAMSVPTAVVADMHIPTLGTNLHMPAKDTGTTLCHVTECPLNCRNYMMLAQELSPVAPDNLTDVESSPHFFLGGNMTSIRRTCFIGSMLAT